MARIMVSEGVIAVYLVHVEFWAAPTAPCPRWDVSVAGSASGRLNSSVSPLRSRRANPAAGVYGCGLCFGPRCGYCSGM